MIGSVPVYAHFFRGLEGEEEPYWRDVGTIEAYFDANMDLCSVKPQLNLYNQDWPTYTLWHNDPPAKTVFSEDGQGRRSEVLDSLLSPGVVVSGAKVRRSVLGNRVRVFPRGGGRWNLRTFVDEERNERIALINSGVQIVVDGIDDLGTVSVETDRIVFWLPNVNLGDAGLAQSLQSGDGPREFYMEGNIVFRQGDRTIYADRMYFDAQREMGVILNAEVLTPLPQTGPDQYQGLVRLRAAAVRQLDRAHFIAQDALITTSRLEEPINRYEVTAVFHGHAHNGAPEGRALAGTPVYNVALPLLYKQYPGRRAVRVVEIPSMAAPVVAS